MSELMRVYRDYMLYALVGILPRPHWWYLSNVSFDICSLAIS